ncbi:MAG: hypothetical protein Q7Q73_03575 [Verrucomicrobiota bacterium JB024]|nr:hypothetical protein [Verrucomicrobiota bacterium JB024]
MQAQEEYRPAYNELLKADWREVFHDGCQDDWSERWMLDGRKATVENTDEGMFFAAGPIADDDASHAVLWTRDSFAGDLRLEFDYTGMDTLYRAVCIVYLYATGAGPAPYVEDISEWNELRQIPAMSTYFDHMNLLHISFAAFDNKTGQGKENAYIRARRYPRSLFGGQFSKMALEPDFSAVGLFAPGVPHHVTVIRRGDDMYMNVTNPDEDRLYYWDLRQVPEVRAGRIGLRHMWQRAALYKDIQVFALEEPSKP